MKKQSMATIECACGEKFTVNKPLLLQAKNKLAEIYCPRGHEISWRGGSSNFWATKDLDILRQMHQEVISASETLSTMVDNLALSARISGKLADFFTKTAQRKRKK
jgi:hypothetical protein